MDILNTEYNDQPIDLNEAANLAGVHLHTWATGSRTSETTKAHYCAYETGQTTVVYSQDKYSLSRLLIDWSLVQMYKSISLVEFAGARGFSIKFVNDNPSESRKKFNGDDLVKRLERKSRRKQVILLQEEKSDEI